MAPPREKGAAGTVRGLASSLSLMGGAAPWLLAGCVVAAVAMGTLPVLTAWATKTVLDLLVAGAALSALVGMAAGLAGAGLLAGVVPHAAHYLRAEMDRSVGLVAKDRLFAAVDRLVGLERFEDPHYLDRLRMAQQAGASSPAMVADGLLGIARSTIMLIGFLGSLLLLAPVMVGLVLAAGVPILIGEIAIARRRARVFYAVGPAERREIFYATLLSSAEAAKEIRLFDIGGFLRSRMLADRRAANAAQQAVDRREVSVHAGLNLLAVVVSGAGLLWAVHAAHRGTLSVGDVTIFVAAVAGVQSGLATLAGELARAHHALLLYDHYLAATTAGPDLPRPVAPRPLPALRRGIELRDVWFRYSDEHPWILRGVNLTIPYGQAVGLVGVNGCGKSTLVKLLCRFYDPTRGAITWDGVDLRQVDEAQLRSRITAVFQDYMNYAMTAAENIGLGDLPSLGDQGLIETAARRARTHEALMALPRGYETLLSRSFVMDAEEGGPESGVVLSGGQWQRLALARALLRVQRDLLILDEPSAGLDAEAEYEIHRSLSRHQAGLTRLLISHRLSALRDAQHIVVLANGRVSEEGDHAALMAAGGTYARLFGIQASGYRDPAPSSAVL
ncbi:ABC transporter ATP-binding protein [Nonomuraea typhae]|uniref:ABC transporter ATP-binding protein n=1 Tax=Nonomuraea typhae TaxID=2603600 RepID=UPI0012F7F296|nr:ABC transporter ATP-binding protein [Nonomuraea typhae]